MRQHILLAVNILGVVLFVYLMYNSMDYLIHHLPKAIYCIPTNDILAACIVIK